jgi:transposase
MLRADVVQEILARLARGEGVKGIARELGVDRKTVKAWRRRGAWRARPRGARVRGLDRFATFLEQRAPEVGWNGAVLHRELCGLGFTGGYLQVQRYLQPLRAAQRWATLATVRFETAPGEQAQVDFGQLRLWIADALTVAHLFVFTLGYSRRQWARAYPHERLDVLLDGHERAFQHFGGVPLSCLYDNPRTQVLGRRDGRVLWHPVFEDFARAYGFTPRACQPYRAQTKGKGESGVKYVKRHALAGRQFPSWPALNAWLEEWSVTVADQRVHGTTHERPGERFARERPSRRSTSGRPTATSGAGSAASPPMRSSPSPPPAIPSPCSTWAPSWRSRRRRPTTRSSPARPGSRATRSGRASPW